MNIGNCHFCGNATGYLKFKICRDCYVKYYIKVKEYLLENADATIEDVSNDLNLPIRLIDQFYGDGILDSTSNLEEDIIKIYQGKKDFEKVQSMFELKSKENKVRVLEKTTNDRMFFLNRKK